MRRNLRLIVCGGRNYDDREHIFATLDHIHAKRVIAEIIEGGASGADFLASEWAAQRGVKLTTVAAHWDQLGRRAGPERNGRMLALKPDGVVAFEGGAGTADMIRQAEAAGVTVMLIPNRSN